jgi:hypothetical protein
MNNIPFRDSVTEQGIFECKLTQKNEGRAGGRRGKKKETENEIKEERVAELAARTASCLGLTINK